MAASDFEMGVTHYRRICTAAEFQFTAYSYFCRKKKSLSRGKTRHRREIRLRALAAALF
jgi:hypothetical protein